MFRGLNIEGEEESWDFGSGASFYLDATVDKWKNYQMYSYITKELPEIVASLVMVDMDRLSIFGHSMGGHGALTIALKNPGRFKSVSAFSPVSNPIECAWGQKAFAGYLGANDKEAWKAYDATELVKLYNGPRLDILIDCGLNDNFHKQGQLLCANFDAVENHNVQVNLRMQSGYDHSYYFIQV